MKTIAYTSPCVPPEWISAHGLTPLRLQPHGPPQDGPIPPTAGVCPYMRAFANQVANAPALAGIVFTSVCDQMRRGHERVTALETPTFCFNMPSTWQTEPALELYMAELLRLSRFLVRSGGTEPDDKLLSTSICSHHELASVFSVQSPLPSSPPGRDQALVPLALTGGPRTQLDDGLLAFIETQGGHIVLDASENGLLGHPSSFDMDLVQSDPRRALADAYLRRLPSVSRRPNNALHPWLKKQVTHSGAAGVILFRYLWCDLWHAEVARLRETLAVPLLDIDLDGEHPIPRNRTRLQAFIEGLR